MADENLRSSSAPGQEPGNADTNLRSKTAKAEVMSRLLASTLVASIPGFSLSMDIRDIFSFSRAARRKAANEERIENIKKLIDYGIDPAVFDSSLEKETDRLLKVKFGNLFLFLTFLFTAASYAIVILDAIDGWKISQVAITALIIETPIQFIGLLYIIARNLFPQKDTQKEDPTKRAS